MTTLNICQDCHRRFLPYRLNCKFCRDCQERRDAVDIAEVAARPDVAKALADCMAAVEAYCQARINADRETQ